MLASCNSAAGSIFKRVRDLLQGVRFGGRHFFYPDDVAFGR